LSDCCVTAFHVDDVCVTEIQERMVGPRRASITVVGEIDHSTYELLHSVLARTWEARPVAVVVDLRRVTFLNAGGLRVLLLASRTARLRQVPLVLQARPGRVSRLLTMVGFGPQLLCSVEDIAVPATEPAVSLPVLHLVVSPDASGTPTSPARDVRTGVTLPARRRPDLRSVPLRCPVHPVSDRPGAGREPVVEDPCPRCDRNV